LIRSFHAEVDNVSTDDIIKAIVEAVIKGK